MQSPFDKSRRVRRFILTYRYASRAQKLHIRTVHPEWLVTQDPNAVDCVCELSPMMFRKGKSLGCHCRKRRHGNPKAFWGIGCKARDEVMEARKFSNTVCKEWRLFVKWNDPDDGEM